MFWPLPHPAIERALDTIPSDVPPSPTTRRSVARRYWPFWLCLTLGCGTALLWNLPRHQPPPPPPLPTGWTRLTTVKHGLSVDLPAEPTKAGPVETANGGSDTTWSCVVDGTSFGLRRQVEGDNPPRPNPKPDDMLNGFCDGMKSSLGPDGSVWQTVTISERPGRELRYRGPKSACVMRLVQIDRTLYFFLIGGTPDVDLDTPDIAHFFDSVRFEN